MNTENENNERKGSRWLRLGLLAFTLAGPVVNAVGERVRKRSQILRDKAMTLQENAQATARQRLNQLAHESRKQIAEQAKQLKQLRSQARRLRKTLRRNVKQRRKFVKKLSRAGTDWSQEMLKRGGQVTGELVERGKEAWEASARMTQHLAKRGSKTTQKLTSRGSKFAQDLVERGQHVLQPPRKRNRNFWAIVGFGVGLVAAGVTTYLFVRRQVVQQETEESQPIELPESGSWNGASDASQGRSESHPAGEIRLVEDIGTTVATLPVVDVEKMQRPEDAAFVGVASTRFYYPAETSLEEKDVIYFASEEEAMAQGFTSAEQ